MPVDKPADLAGPAPRDVPTRGSTASLIDAIRMWARSDALQQLVAVSGLPWLEGSTAELVTRLAAQSAIWDFRRADGGERHGLTSRPAEVAGKRLDEELAARLAAEVCTAVDAPVDGELTHVVVLGGMVLACRLRAEGAARHVAGRPETPAVAMLTARRPLGGVEPLDARRLGWGELEFEDEAAAKALQAAFGLPPEPTSAEVHQATGGPPGAERGEWQRRRSWAQQRWLGEGTGATVDLITAPSSAPDERRANTPDQLTFWAERTTLGPTDRVLIVTTEHYAVAQHFEAVRCLTLPFGCGVATRGVAWEPIGPYRAAALLQEVRSALLAADRLLRALAISPPFHDAGVDASEDGAA